MITRLENVWVRICTSSARTLLKPFISWPLPFSRNNFPHPNKTSTHVDCKVLGIPSSPAASTYTTAAVGVPFGLPHEDTRWQPMVTWLSPWLQCYNPCATRVFGKRTSRNPGYLSILFSSYLWVGTHWLLIRPGSFSFFLKNLIASLSLFLCSSLLPLCIFSLFSQALVQLPS